MPTLFEKYSEIEQRRIHGETIETCQAASLEAQALRQTPAYMAWSDALSTQNDLESQLRKLNQSIDNFQAEAAKVKARLEATQHAVKVLQSVEVP